MAETKFLRTRKERNYTMIDNTFIRDTTLSWKAKGVMTYLLSLPDDWSVNFSEVLRHSTDGETALKSTIKELKEHGYLISKRLQSADGKFTGFTYEIVENPIANEHQVEKPLGGKPTEREIHLVENDQLLNTKYTKDLDIQNTDLNSCSSEEKPISPQKEVIAYYYECWKELYQKRIVSTEKPFVSSGKVAGTISRLLKNGVTVESIKLAVKKALDDDWIVGTGYSLSTILSENVFNRLLNAKPTSQQRGGYDVRTAGKLACDVIPEDYILPF